MKWLCLWKWIPVLSLVLPIRIWAQSRYEQDSCLTDLNFQTALREVQSISPQDARISQSNFLIQSWFPVPKLHCEVEAQVQMIQAFEAVANHALECFTQSSENPTERCRLLLNLAAQFISQFPKQTLEPNKGRAVSAFNQTISNLSAKAEEVKSQLDRASKGGKRRRGKITSKEAETEFSILFATLQAIHDSWATNIDRKIEVQLPYLDIPLPVEQVINLVSAARAIHERNYETSNKKLGEVIFWIQNQPATAPNANSGSFNPDMAPYISIPTQPLPLNQLVNLADAYMSLEGRSWENAQKKLGYVLKWMKEHSPPAPNNPRLPGGPQPRPGGVPYPQPPRTNPQQPHFPYPPPYPPAASSGYPPNPQNPQPSYPYQPQPGYPYPPQPGYPQPQPAYPQTQPGYPQPGYPQPPRYPQPGYPQPPSQGP